MSKEVTVNFEELNVSEEVRYVITCPMCKECVDCDEDPEDFEVLDCSACGGTININH